MCVYACVMRCVCGWMCHAGVGVGEGGEASCAHTHSKEGTTHTRMPISYTVPLPAAGMCALACLALVCGGVARCAAASASACPLPGFVEARGERREGARRGGEEGRKGEAFNTAQTHSRPPLHYQVHSHTRTTNTSAHISTARHQHRHHPSLCV